MRRKSAEPFHGLIETERVGEIKSRIEQLIVGSYSALGNCNAVQRCSGINAKSDGEVGSVAAAEAPAC